MTLQEWMIILNHLDPFGGSNIALSDAKLYWSSSGPRELLYQESMWKHAWPGGLGSVLIWDFAPARDLMHGGNPNSKFKVKRHSASAFASGWLIDKRLTIIEHVFRMRIQNTSEYMVLN